MHRPGTLATGTIAVLCLGIVLFVGPSSAHLRKYLCRLHWFLLARLLCEVGHLDDDHSKDNFLSILECLACPASPRMPAPGRSFSTKSVRSGASSPSRICPRSSPGLSALKSRDDLVTQIVAKYSYEKGQVQRDVDALLKGRQI
jgi:hypothetical protein